VKDDEESKDYNAKTGSDEEQRNNILEPGGCMHMCGVCVFLCVCVCVVCLYVYKCFVLKFVEACLGKGHWGNNQKKHKNTKTLSQ